MRLGTPRIFIIGGIFAFVADLANVARDPSSFLIADVRRYDMAVSITAMSKVGSGD